MKERPISFSAPMVRAILDGKKTMTRRPVKGLCGDVVYHDLCSYGKTGDRLWVREPFNGIDPLWHYEATSDLKCFPWKPSQRMPREASRILLEITSVRVERLQNISEEDAIAEGVTTWFEFRDLWESIYGGKQGIRWQDDPVVWVISFKVLEVRR
jgi:hypothetical protein